MSLVLTSYNLCLSWGWDVAQLVNGAQSYGLDPLALNKLEPDMVAHTVIPALRGKGMTTTSSALVSTTQSV